MKLIVSIFVLCSAIFASSFGRRPFVDPSVMRSKIYEDMNPYFITATNKFNELDDITSAAFQRGILVFPDLLISIRNDLNRRFERLCGNCRNDLRKYETELNINYEVLREEYSFDKVRIRFEETFQDVASRLLTPIRTYVDELRDYKSNYRNSGECWKLFKTTLFGIVKETHQNITNDLQGIKSNLESLVQNITLEFKAATDNQTATADSCNNYSRGSRDMCKFLAYDEGFSGYVETLQKSRRQYYAKIEDNFDAFTTKIYEKVPIVKDEIQDLSKKMDDCLETSKEIEEKIKRKK